MASRLMDEVVKAKRSATVTRIELAEAVYAAVSLPRKNASQFVDQVLDEIIAALVRDGVVTLSNFGTFNVRSKTERIGRNPIDMKAYIIPARRSVTFRPSPRLKQKINTKIEIADE